LKDTDSLSLVRTRDQRCLFRITFINCLLDPDPGPYSEFLFFALAKLSC